MDNAGVNRSTVAHQGAISGISGPDVGPDSQKCGDDKEASCGGTSVVFSRRQVMVLQLDLQRWAWCNTFTPSCVRAHQSVGSRQPRRTDVDNMDVMDVMECYASTYLQDSGIDPILRRCSPSDGMCYSSLTTVKESSTVQLGCWPGPDANDGVTVMYAGAQCLHEAHRLLCLCTGHLCNQRPPQFDEGSPEGTDWHGAVVVGYVGVALLVLVALVVLLWRECRGNNTSNKVIDGLVRNIQAVESTNNVSGGGRTNVSCIEDNGVFSITRGPKAVSYVPRRQPSNVKRIVNDLHAV